MSVEFIRLDRNSIDDLTALAVLARGEGYLHMERLVTDLLAGIVGFDGIGERLIGGYVDGRLVAVGGIHRDPYAANDAVGRLRRVYVAPEHRNVGIGSAMMAKLVAIGAGHFRCVRLRAPDDRAARFYEANGFSPIAASDATHSLTCRSVVP